MHLDYLEKIFDQAIKTNSETEFTQKLLALLDNYKILSRSFERGSVFWRARKINSTRFKNISDLVCPPANLVNNGRLNDAGEPILYTSLRKETALAEISASEGDLVQLAGFRIKPNHTLRVATIGDFAQIQKTGNFRVLGPDPEMVITKMLNSMPKDFAQAYIYTDSFLATILADINASQENYMRTRALGRLIHTRITADGIAFPSVKDRDGYNICIKNDSSKKSLQNVCCLIVKINKKRRYGLIDFDFLDSAERLDNAGDFIWHNDTSPNSFGMYNLTETELRVATKSKDNPNGYLELIRAK